MIVARIKGGLGNQLFQYALARQVADRFDTELILDIGHFDSFPLRRFELDRFEIRAEVTRLVHGDKEVPGFDFASQGLTLVRPEVSGFDARYLDGLQPGDYYLDGYWDAWRYADGARAFADRDLRLGTAPPGEVAALVDEVRDCESVCVHFRRGDYVTSEVINQIFGVCGIDYYQRALDGLLPRLREPRLYLFSDDIEWVRENFRPDAPMVSVSDKTAGDVICDFEVMRNCHSFVTANSTLSWWAAFLGAAGDKVVCCPQRWMAREENAKPDLVPPDWLRV